MSIFLSKKAKENAKGFWYGLLLPIIVGVGSSLLSMGVMIRFESSFVGPDDNFIEYFFLTLYAIGFLLIWPLFAHRLFSGANELGNIPLKDGARVSIILYLCMVFFAVLPSAFFSVLEYVV